MDSYVSGHQVFYAGKQIENSQRYWPYADVADRE